MSQKKLKKLRKIESEAIKVEEKKIEDVKGVRRIIKENWLFLLLLIIGVVAVYFNGMAAKFVSDDYASITQNQDVKSFSAMIKGVTLSAFGTWLVANLFGTESSIPYHVLSLLIYCLILVIGFVFIYVVFDRKTAILSLLLFAFLPVHVESVTWISGKPYIMNALFVLIDMTLSVLYLKTKKKKYLWTMIGLLPLTYIADRVRSFSFVILLILYLISFKQNLPKFNFKKILAISISIVVIMGIIIWPKIVERINGVNSGYNGSGGIFYNPFFQYPTAIPKYLQLILAPTDLTLYHTMYILPDWLNWSIFLLYLTTVVYFFFKDKKMFFASAFVFVAAAPSMAPVKVSWLVAERYIFLGSLGFSIFLVLFFQRFSRKMNWVFLPLLVITLGVYSARIYFRNIDWQTNHNLWINTCQVSPNSHNAWNNIGDDYDKLAQLEKTQEGQMTQYLNAIKGFSRSTMVKTDYADAYHNRANIFYKIGRYDLARESYETALYYGPNLYQSYFSLLQIDLLEKRYDSAMSHLERLNKTKPNDPQVYYVTAVVYANMGRKNEAMQILQQILSAYPNFKDAANLFNYIKSQT